MEKTFVNFEDLINKVELSKINYTYVNRNSLNLLDKDIPNTELRVGERYILFLLNIFRSEKIQSTNNFDFNGYGHKFFELCQKNKYSISLYGGTDMEMKKFKSIIANRYNLEIINAHNGYEEIEFYVHQIMKNHSDVKILSLGNPKQNDILEILANQGILGMHTCGAFISQESLPKRNPILPTWLFRSLTEKKHFFRTISTTISSAFFILKKYWF
jgi:UDP-N-acetyl-D-mannosaminuronic acid transferase (WecB/TagA/CpsF family)